MLASDSSASQEDSPLCTQVYLEHQATQLYFKTRACHTGGFSRELPVEQQTCSQQALRLAKLDLG